VTRHIKRHAKFEITLDIKDDEFINSIRAGQRQLLRHGGVFTYLSNEIDSLSRRHQRALSRHVSRIATSIVEIPVSKNLKDTWWSGRMVAVEATK